MAKNPQVQHEPHDPHEPQGWTRVLWNHEEGRLPAGWRILLLLLATLATQVAVYVYLSHSLGWSSGTTRTVYLLAALTVLLLAIRWLDRRSLASLGLAWRDRLRSSFGRDLGLGLALGLGTVGVVFVALWAFGWLEIREVGFSRAVLAPLAGALGLFALTGLYEEALCRGYLLSNIAEGLHGRRVGARGALVAGWIVSSLLFGLMHAGNPHAGWLGLVNVVLLGAVFALPYLVTGSLAVPIGLHIAWNFASGPLFGLPVSGTAPTQSLLVVSVEGPTLWTGTAFGPEAGLLVTLAALLLAAMLLAILGRRAGGLELRHELAKPPTRPEGPSYPEPSVRGSRAPRRPPASLPEPASPASPTR